MADRPKWIPFDLDDYCSDPLLRACSLDTQGFYVHLMKVLSRCHPYGYFIVSGEPPPPKLLASLTGFHHLTCRKAIADLQKHEVLKQDEQGRWYSQRMLSDYEKWLKHHDDGKKGGNPYLTGKGVNPPVKAGVNLPLKVEEIREEREERENEPPTPALRSFIDHWCQTIGPLVLAPETSCDLGDLYRDFSRELPPGAKPVVDILCAEIDELKKRPPTNRNVKYFAAMIWGKLNE